MLSCSHKMAGRLVFFFIVESEYQRFRAEGEEALENASFPGVRRFQNIHFRRKGW